MKPLLRTEFDDFGRTEPFAADIDSLDQLGRRISFDSIPSAPRPAPPRRFDHGAMIAAERLILNCMYSLCGFLAVVLISQGLTTALGGDWSNWQFWAVLFPIGLALPAASKRFQLGGHAVVEVLTLVGLCMRTLAVVVVLEALFWVIGTGATSPQNLISLILLHIALCWSGRWLFRLVTPSWRRKLRVVVVGAGAHGAAVAKHLLCTSDDIEVIGFVDERRTRIDAEPTSAPFLGNIDDLCANDFGADIVMLAMPNTASLRIQSLTMLIRCRGIDVYLAPEPNLLTIATTKHSIDALGSSLLLNLYSLPLGGRISKRLFDITFATLALIAFIPVGLVIIALIKLESPGPAIFRQPRFGRGNYLFDVYKFRSMRFDADRKDGEIVLTERVDSRVTRMGHFLRRTSLDEFPQFLNVLLGDMSVVGPRPHPPGVKAGDRIYEDVVPGFMERYTLRPGITGWAQVNGLRGNTFTENHLIDRFAYDVQYIRNWSLELDVWIVFKTIKDGFGGKNAF